MALSSALNISPVALRDSYQETPFGYVHSHHFIPSVNCIWFDLFLGHFSSTHQMAGLPAKRQLFAEVNKLDQSFYKMKYDGLVGLAFTSMARNGAPVPMDLLKKQHKIKENVFAFCIYRWNSNKKSVLIIGGSDERLYHQPMYFIPLSVDGFWQFLVQRIMIGNYVLDKRVQAIVDSGTTLIAGPHDKIHILHTKMKAIRYRKSTTHIVRCSRIREMATFILEAVDRNGVRRQFTLGPRQYIRKVNTMALDFRRVNSLIYSIFFFNLTGSRRYLLYVRFSRTSCGAWIQTKMDFWPSVYAGILFCA